MISCLESAREYLRREQIPDCPVCKTPFSQGQLLKSIEERLLRLQNAQTAAAKRTRAVQSLAAARSLLEDVRSRIAGVPAALEAACFGLSEMQDDDAKAILRAIQGFKTEFGTPNQVHPEKLMDDITTRLDARDGRSRARDALLRTAKQAKRLLKTISEQRKDAQALADAAQRAEQVVAIVEAERKKFVDEVLIDISSEVNRLFAVLHPDEKVGGIRLALKTRGQGSVEMTGEFHGRQDVPPEAFFSDSHLDTLGICIFVALAKRGGSANTVLVFDDVVSSIDRDHLSRLVQLIADESENFGHTVITTHLELLEEHFRHHPDTRDRTQFDRIAEWSLADGFRVAAREFQVDLLRAMVGRSPLDKIGAGGKAGHLLEVLLHQLALSFKVPMPLKAPPKYVLSEYFQSFSRDWRENRVKLDLPGPTGTVSTPLASFLDPIEKTAWVRNIVDHGNFELNSMLPENDVRNFAVLVLKLHDEFCENIPPRKRVAC